MKEIVKSHILALIIYLASFTVLRWVFPKNIGMIIDLIGLWFGAAIGMVLLDLDRVVHVYFERPHEQLSQQVQQNVKVRQWKDAIETLLLRRNEQYHLAFRNGVFGLIFLVIVFFAFSSTAGLFGKGLVAGVMFHFLYDAWRDYLKDRKRFSSWFTWMVAREVPMREQKIALWVITGAFGLMHLLVI
jgi:hypothetical protein